MKKTSKIISVVLAVLFVFSAMTAMTVSAAQLIKTAEAKNIAYADAGVTAADVVYSEAILDRDQGVLVYDVEFFTADYEYDYEINAQTGAIVKKDLPDPTKRPTQQQGEVIGTETAKAIALAYYNFTADQVKFVKAEYEVDDGIKVYEIEYTVDGMEYDVEIDAVSGEILNAKSEKEETNDFIAFFKRLFEAIKNFFERLFNR